MPRPTHPVNDPTAGLHDNSCLRDVDIYLKENPAPKSTVTLFTPDTHQFQTHPDITLEDTQLPLERSPKILEVIMDLSFRKHCNYRTRETILLTYNALGKSIASYGAPTQVTRAIRRCRQHRMWL